MSSNAVYLRISSDRLGTELGVDRQREACHALMAARGMTIDAEYMDNSVSAYSKKPRPSYERMLADVKAGLIDTVVFYDLDRLTRRPSEGEAWIKLNDSLGVNLIATNEDIDLSKPNGRLSFRIRIDISVHEVEHKSERQKAANKQRANKGVPITGRRPFGFENDRMTVRESEAVHIREAYRDYLAGASIYSLVRRLNDAGLVTSMGKPWTPAALKYLLRNPSNAGLMFRKGIEMTKSKITAIVSRADWEATVKRMATNVAPSGPKLSKGLLNGLMFCVCGQPMVRKTVYTGKDNDRKPTYLCEVKAYRVKTDTNRHVTIGAEIAEGVVTEAVINLFLNGRFNTPVKVDVHLTRIIAELAEVRADINSATDVLMTRNANKARIEKRLAELAGQERALEAERDQRMAEGAELDGMAQFREGVERWAGSGVAWTQTLETYQWGLYAWNELPVQTRRTLIRASVRAEVTPGGYGAKRVQVTPV